MKIKDRVYEVLEDHTRDRATNIANLAICGLIGLNLVAFTLSTVDSLFQSWSTIFNAIETTSVLVFSIEYALRLWSCTANKRYSAPLLGRLRFAATPLLLIALFAI